MAKSSLVWKGKAVTGKMRRAQITGVNTTMARCVQHAKNNHDWKNQTAVLEGSIAIADYARERAQGVAGRWGSRDVKYALIHELGGTITAKNAPMLAIPQADGGVAFVKSVTVPARPYLRPAADVHYRGLADDIRAAFARGGGGA